MCHCDEPQLYKITYPVSRKVHSCGTCGWDMPLGTKHQKYDYLFDGEWGRTRMCPNCEAIMDMLYAHPAVDCDCGEPLELAEELSSDIDDCFVLIGSITAVAMIERFYESEAA